MIAALLLSGAALAASAAGLQASWVVPPSAAAPKADDALAGVDPSGAAWLVLDGRIVSAPERGAVLVADRPIQQLAWIGARPVARSFDALGTFVPEPDAPKGPKRARFKPLTTVPLTSWRMAPAGDGNIFIAGYNPRKRASQIALVGPSAGGKDLRVIYETRAQIADVAGDGTSAFFASGPAIWKVGADGTASVFFSQTRPITALAAARDGLFYATDAGVGFAGRTERFELLRRPGCRIAARDGELFVLLDGLRGGLLRVRGADGRLVPDEQNGGEEDQSGRLMRGSEDDGDPVQQSERPESDLRGRHDDERVERRRRAPR